MLLTDDPEYAGTRLPNISKDAFMEKVREFLEPKSSLENAQLSDRPALVDGYGTLSRSCRCVADSDEGLICRPQTNPSVMSAMNSAVL